MIDDVSFQYVAGVHPVGRKPPEQTRRDLITGEPIGMARAWDGIQENDDETSRDYWRHAGRLTNDLLVEHLQTLQDRSSDEFLGNPIVEGVIARHVVDTVGDDAPALSVDCEDWEDEKAATAYATAVESIWREVADEPTTDGESSLADWIGTALAEDWLSGGTTDLLESDPDVKHPIKTRLQSIDIARLQTPPGEANNSNVLLGIERSRLGRPRRYFFADNPDGLSYGVNFTPVAADRVVHGYLKRRRGLARGYPLLSGLLGLTSEIRQLDRSVIDVAMNAAMLGVFAYTTSEMAEAASEEELKKPLKFRRKGIPFIPSHWQLDAVQSHNPGPDLQMRRELTAQAGRPAAMPGLSVNMDASGHNYSSARFDDRGYVRSIGKWRNHCERRRLNPYAKRVILEAEFRGLVPMRLGPVKLSWQWRQTAGIDPLKDALAQAKRLENRTTSPIRTAAEEGNDFEKLAKEWRRAIDILQKYDLPLELAGTPMDEKQLAESLKNDN